MTSKKTGIVSSFVPHRVQPASSLPSCLRSLKSPGFGSTTFSCSSHGQHHSAAICFWTLYPPLTRPGCGVDTAESLWNLYKDQTTVLSVLGITGLAEEIEWIKQAAYAQILHRPPPTRPPLASLSAAAAAPASAVSAAAAAPVSAVSAAAAAPVSAVPAAPATVATTVSAAAPDAPPSAAVSTSLPGPSRRRRRTRRPKISPEAKPDISAEAAPTAADVTSFSPVSRPSADAAALWSLARAPRIHEDQLWDFFYGDRDDLLPCWSAPDETPTAYEAGVHTASPTTAEVPTAHATAQAYVGVRASAESSALPAAESSTLPAIVEAPASLVTLGVPAAHATAKACVGAHISPLPVFTDFPLADERKEPPAVERKDHPQAEVLQSREGVPVDPLPPYAPESSEARGGPGELASSQGSRVL
ncbi:angiomotin-like [Fundulus heteroclitus]|uniref:angiomotin-like n=1 Tax=Fundulus heteroclitus TaxID=8078 RepID=UPI00165C190C|nr:angiomotin-like [Fundulus heteroclitus]